MSGTKQGSLSKGSETKKEGKDSDLFKPLVRTAEHYLRDYCDGKQHDDEKAKFALRVLSVYRRILKVEKEKEEIKAEWKKLIEGAAELRKLMRRGRVKEIKKSAPGHPS
jgi:hypothetical protein